MIASRCAEIREAADALYELSSDAETRARYEAYEKAWRDRMAEIDYAHNDGLKKGLEKGREEGLEKGRAEKTLEVAKNLRASGVSIEIIAKATGLPQEEIAGWGT